MIVALILMLKVYIACSQTTKTIVYDGLGLDEVITNPERGFYYPIEVHAKAAYEPLDSDTLDSVRAMNITLLLREFYLESFLNTPISTDFLNNIKSDLDLVRSTGFKCIVRFAYSDSTNDTVIWDANKAQIMSHIGQLKEILITYGDVIAYYQAGFIGAYGEWYYTNNFGYPNPDMTSRKEVINALLASVPANRMIQVRTPAFKRAFYGTSPLTQSQAFQQTDVSRIGHHNDCFLADQTDAGTYQNLVEEKSYLEQDTRYTPMGGETCALDPSQANWCTAGLSEMQRFKWTYLNIGYHPDVIQKFKDGNCFLTIQNRLGYRFRLVSGTFPLTLANNQLFNIQLKVTNDGFATMYNPRTVQLVLRNSALNLAYSLDLKTDPRFWAPGQDMLIQEVVTLTNVIPATYELLLNMPDASPSLVLRPEYSVRLANQQTWESNSGLNKLNHNLIVTN